VQWLETVSHQMDPGQARASPLRRKVHQQVKGRYFGRQRPTARPLGPVGALLALRSSSTSRLSDKWSPHDHEQC
jgi:hypothetical protein